MSVHEKFDDFDASAIKILNSIIKETDAEIIISSDWQRWANIDELGEFYERQGIIKKPIDSTHTEIPLDENEHKNIQWDNNIRLEQERSLFILRWLKQHPEITHWAAIDDLNMAKTLKAYPKQIERDWGLTNFIWTPRQNEGIKQCGIKDKIINFLK